MEAEHKPQWVCRLLVFFKAMLEGRHVDGSTLECVANWNAIAL